LRSKRDLGHGLEGIYLSMESEGELSRGVCAGSMKSYQSDEAGVEGSPLSYGRRAMRHVAESLKLCEYPFTKASNLGVLPLRELSGVSDQMSKAALPQANPFAVDPVAVAHQNAFPVPNESFEGFLGTVSMDHEKGYGGIGHNPEPLEHFLLAERGLINLIDLGLSCHFADFIVVGSIAEEAQSMIFWSFSHGSVAQANQAVQRQMHHGVIFSAL
jgi:hypothetical protein